MARQKSPVISINPLFKLLIWVNSGLCLLTFIGMVAMAFIAPKDPTPAQVQLSTACETVFKMTAGAFIGLLGGRAAAPDPAQQAAPATPAGQPAGGAASARRFRLYGRADAAPLLTAAPLARGFAWQTTSSRPRRRSP